MDVNGLSINGITILLISYNSFGYSKNTLVFANTNLLID